MALSLGSVYSTGGRFCVTFTSRKINPKDKTVTIPCIATRETESLEGAVATAVKFSTDADPKLAYAAVPVTENVWHVQANKPAKDK